ncbi:hypothetical protein C453_14863 [Haloferax elongans ATCC BAA-1513]|uniref:Uncharacterized protein n=1 Tax=Haloferax elongans ATCC BAA-1513 TaxID=1230453 RepID=M0HCW1_HALEO|nr:hypothetical protein C453_14863 [Haloferax elongans ATCC BAA-1513]
MKLPDCGRLANADGRPTDAVGRPNRSTRCDAVRRYSFSPVRKEKSRLGALWVSHPIETTSTPVAA